MIQSRQAWILIEADSRAVELFTALFLLSAGVSCAVGGWFSSDSGWLARPGFAQWAEYALAAASAACAWAQIEAIRRGVLWLRWWMAAIAGFSFLVAGMLVLSRYGLTVPGGPMFLLGGVVQLWVMLSIASDMRAAGWQRG